MSGVSGFSGADPEQLDGLARLFEESAARINEIVGSVRTLAQEAVWAGADADQFRRQVNDELAGAASRGAELVREAGEQVRRQAAQQREASGDVGIAGAVTAGSGAVGAVTSAGAAAGPPAAAGRGISDVIANGPAPAHDWHTSPRVASLIELCQPHAGAPVAHAVAVRDVIGSGSAPPPLLQADTLEVPSNWAQRALGLE